MGKLRRDYINVDERNFYMVTKCYLQMVEGKRTLDNRELGRDYWDILKEHGMLTPSMQKSLKTGYTNLKKFIYELEENLSKSQMQTLNKRMEKFDYRIIDDYTLQKIYRDASDKFKYAVIPIENLEPVLQDIASVRCVGCKENYENCHLCKMMQDIEMPYVSEESNCPYASVLDKFTEEDKKSIQEMKEIVKGRHSFTESFPRKSEFKDKVKEEPKKITGKKNRRKKAR